MPEFTADDGAQLHYVVEGEGEPAIIFVHGWCSNLHHWGPQAEHFAGRHRVLRLDRRGYGRSPVPASYHFDLDREAADIAQLAASLSIDDAVVVGHAGGVPTAIALAAGHPELVRALVCEEGAAVPADPSVAAMLAGMIQQLSGPNYGDVMQVIYPGFFHPDTDQERVAACTADAARTAQEVAVGYLEAMPNLDTDERARGVRMPALFVWAEQPLMPVTLAQLRELVPQAQLVEIPGTAHFAHLDAPDLFNQQLDVFIEDVAARNAMH